MNYRRIIKLTNILAIISIIALIYWVFIITVISIFDLRVFQKSITDLFLMSLTGILAVMAGTLMINIMINLTRIAERGEEFIETRQMIMRRRIRTILFLVSFPLIGIALSFGHFYTLQQRELYLERSANQIISSHTQSFDKFSQYEFDKTWIYQTRTSLNILSSYNSSLPNITVIIQDDVENSSNYLEFGKRYYDNNDVKSLEKSQFLLSTTAPQRAYLDLVFSGKTSENLYERQGNNYKLFVPYHYQDKTIVILFSDYYAYGKSGS